MSINKSIIKTYKLLFRYSSNNKFRVEKNSNLIPIYLLFIQNKYDLKLNFKKQTKSILLYKCLKSLYKDIDDRKVKNLLFSEEELLGSIFLKKDNFNVDKFLLKLEETTYSLNYVNTNIQLVDYLGNTENDMNVNIIGLCYLLFKEQFPHIKINSNLHNNIIDNLLKTAKPKNGKINYINTESVMLLFLLGKIKKFSKLDEFINLLIKTQKNNGLWIHGFNSYLMEEPKHFDILHTCFALIVLYEYQILQKYKEITSPSPTINVLKEKINKKNIKEENHKNVIERFDNINDITKNSYYFDLNFYNTTLILIIVLIGLNFSRINKIFLYNK